MFWKKKAVAPKGALEKLALAKQMKETAEAEKHMKAGGGRARTYSQTIPVTVIFVLAVAFAMYMTDGAPDVLSKFRPTGVYSVDSLLTGSTPPSITGDRDADHLVVILIRGFALFLAAGFIPLLSYVIFRASGGEKLNPLVVAWGVCVVTPALLYFSGDLLSGLLEQLAELF